MRRWPIRARAAAVLVVLAAAVQAILVLRGVGLTTHPPDSEISAYERRFDALRAYLPGDAVVGFLMASPPEAVLAHPAKAAYFFRMQYTLAPVLVLNDPDQTLMAADSEALAFDSAVFESDDGDQVIALPDDRKPLELVRDFGADVRLYRQATP